MNLHTIQNKILCSTNLMQDLFSFFESLKLFGGLNVIIKVRIVQILSNIKRKEPANQNS